MREYLNPLPKQTGNVLEIDKYQNATWLKMREDSVWKMIDGTSFMDGVTTDYWTLVKLFGQPEVVDSFDDKLQVQWVISTPYGVATIYDWKEAVNPTKVTNWHIGGNNNDVSDFIIDRVKMYDLAYEKAIEHAFDLQGEF